MGNMYKPLPGSAPLLGSVSYIAIQLRAIYRIIAVYWTTDSACNVAGIVFDEEWLTIIVASVFILYATSGGG